MGLCRQFGDVYIITEFVTGGDVSSFLQNPTNDMTWKIIERVAAETAQASQSEPRLLPF